MGGVEADQIPYIESLGDRWGELCASKPVASAWADRLIGVDAPGARPRQEAPRPLPRDVRLPQRTPLAGRYEEILDILQADSHLALQALGGEGARRQGRKAEAIRYAESCRGPGPDAEVDQECEAILLSSGMIEEAYERYGLRANRGATYLATFRAVARKYPHRAPREILADLVKTTPGDEGKWFAAAKEAGLYDEALALAGRTPCDPKTLTRAARDHAEEQPAFATGAGLLALHWLVQGYGYEITGADVRAAYSSTMKAAEASGKADEVRERIRQIVGAESREASSRGYLDGSFGHEGPRARPRRRPRGSGQDRLRRGADRRPRRPRRLSSSRRAASGTAASARHARRPRRRTRSCGATSRRGPRALRSSPSPRKTRPRTLFS